MEQGKAIIVSAPSGAGKTTIVKHLLALPLNLEFSISACSRAIRENERNAIDYHFLDVATFKTKIDKGEFVEWEEVYPNHYYGTLRSEIDKIWESGKHVIFDVDVVGGQNLKKAFGARALAIFVQPPSIDVLEQRLRNRRSESEEMLQKRVGKAQKELEQAPEFDVVLVNDDLNRALQEAEETVKNFLEK